MSLISDALKRQEQLRAPRAGAAQREVAAAQPAVGNREQGMGNGERGMGNGEPLNRQTGKTSDTLSGSASSATLRENPTQPKQPSNRQTVKPSNPFIERERVAARRSNHSVLLMPVLGLIMLLVLLFLRREFAPSSPQATVRKVVEGEKWKVESAEDAAVISDLFPEEGTGKREEETGNREEANSGDAQITALEPATSNFLSASAASAPLSENPPQFPSELPEVPEPSNRQTVKPSNPAAEAPPQQPATWPPFTLTGIAVGRERLAILNTGEMLLAGETAKCGVKVEKVNASTVVFAWGGETKTLRKGEHSDKPAD